jgi:hypothetical protein
VEFRYNTLWKPLLIVVQVREATNNEPWGASTTMMNDIAAGTFN